MKVKVTKNNTLYMQAAGRRTQDIPHPTFTFNSGSFCCSLGQCPAFHSLHSTDLWPFHSIFNLYFFCCLLEGTKSVTQLDSLSASPFTTTERSDRTQHHSTKAAIHDELDDKKYQVEQSAAIHFTDLGFNSTYQLPISCRYLFFYLPFTRGKLADLPLPSNCDTNLITVDCRLPPSIIKLGSRSPTLWSVFCISQLNRTSTIRLPL